MRSYCIVVIQAPTRDTKGWYGVTKHPDTHSAGENSVHSELTDAFTWIQVKERQAQ